MVDMTQFIRPIHLELWSDQLNIKKLSSESLHMLSRGTEPLDWDILIEKVYFKLAIVIAKRF